MPSESECATSWGDVVFTSPAATTIYLTGVSSAATRAEAARNPRLGLLVTPASGLAAQIPYYQCYAADNACFTETPEDPFDPDRWLAWLKRLPLERCLFATLPDVPFDAEATWRRSQPFIEVVRRLGFPVALVAQNGIETMGNLEQQLQAVDAVFIGGDDAWKLSPATAELGRRVRELGRWTHVGRVNSWKRLDQLAGAGFDSVDGTYLRFPANAGRLFSWLDALTWESYPRNQEHRFDVSGSSTRARVATSRPRPVTAVGETGPGQAREPRTGFAAEVAVGISGEAGEALRRALDSAAQQRGCSAGNDDDLEAGLERALQRSLRALPIHLRRGWTLLGLRADLEGALRLRGPRIGDGIDERRPKTSSIGTYRTSGQTGPFEGCVSLCIGGDAASVVSCAMGDGMRAGSGSQRRLRDALEWLVGEGFSGLGEVLEVLDFELPEVELLVAAPSEAACTTERAASP